VKAECEDFVKDGLGCPNKQLFDAVKQPTFTDYTQHMTQYDGDAHVDAAKSAIAEGKGTGKLLCDAGKKGHHLVIRHLVVQGVDKDAADGHGSTALTLCSEHGHLDAVRELVRVGADFEKADNDGDAPLVCAAIGGHLEVHRFLLENGADAGKKNKKGMAALDKAKSKNHAEIVALLEGCNAVLKKCRL
jgi:ankyrin repeat protein